MLIALSGGVDSATVAKMLLEQGFHCISAYMITCEKGLSEQAQARKVAQKLDIEFHVLDLRQQFESINIYFIDQYRRGRTPNPCVMCNREIKFGKLWQFAKSQNADFIATGHYARKISSNGQTGIYEAKNPKKDQSYVLAMIDPEVLPHILLPLGNQDKQTTIEMAKDLNLGLERKGESQEICFIPDDDYVAEIENRCPEMAKEGNIVDVEGNILGTHNGIHRFTIGQRRGLKVAMGIPYYVTKLDPETNTVTLGPKALVMNRKLKTSKVNCLTPWPKRPFQAKVKIRYNSPAKPATVQLLADQTAKITFNEHVSAITPGQLAAVYIQEEKNLRLIGGGWIDYVDQSC